MKTKIEIRGGFILRSEDYIYMLIFVFPSILSLYIYFVNDWDKKSHVLLTFLVVNIFFFILSIILILLSYQNRKSELCWIEDDSIVKYNGEKLIFKIPINRIVSIRVQDRKGDSGSIIFFTNGDSKDYWHTYTPFNMSMRLDVHGLTKNKINLIKDRKWLIGKIIQVNPNLHFIESH